MFEPRLKIAMQNAIAHSNEPKDIIQPTQLQAIIANTPLLQGDDGQWSMEDIERAVNLIKACSDSTAIEAMSRRDKKIAARHFWSPEHGLFKHLPLWRYLTEELSQQPSKSLLSSLARSTLTEWPKDRDGFGDISELIKIKASNSESGWLKDASEAGLLDVNKGVASLSDILFESPPESISQTLSKRAITPALRA